MFNAMKKKEFINEREIDKGRENNNFPKILSTAVNLGTGDCKLRKCSF